MHFWIDKRSQCAYPGRHRVPPSISVGRSRGLVCGAGVGAAGRKGMAAPVHRFAAVECPPRRPHRAQRHYGPVLAGRRAGAEGGGRAEAGAAGPAQPTIASLAAARSVTPDTLLRTAALGLQPSPVLAPHLKLGMLVSFALATMFLAGVKFYFDVHMARPGGGGAGAGGAGGGEAAVLCAAVVFLCGVGCVVSVCRARPPPPLPPDRVSSTAQRDRQPPPSEPSDDISLATLLQTSERSQPTESPEAPPPYKIAVLMPGRESPPPPAYSELS